MAVMIRKATKEDIDGLYALIQHYADKEIMLPRSKEMLVYLIPDFVVAELDGRIIGCGSLSKLGDDLVEVRSLGIYEEFKGMGIGAQLLDFLTLEAQSLGIPKLMALTYEVGFFEKHGFSVVSMDILPEKVWTDCVHCKKQDRCDEIAVFKRLDIT